MDFLVGIYKWKWKKCGFLAFWGRRLTVNQDYCKMENSVGSEQLY